MAQTCSHLDTVHEVAPSAAGCEDCLRTGDRWVHLRICQSCGHIGCCDSSPNRHATAHFHAQPTTGGGRAGSPRPARPTWLVG